MHDVEVVPVAEPLIGTRLVVALGVNQAQHAEDFIDHEVRVLVMHLVAGRRLDMPRIWPEGGVVIP